MASPIPFIASATPGSAPDGAIPVALYGIESDKPAIVALTAIATADAVASVGVPTKAEFDAVVALANASKAKINQIIAALKA